MSKLITRCQVCSKEISEVSRVDFGLSFYVTLKCGHSYVEEKGKSSHAEIEFRDGTKLYPFQYENIEKTERANFRALITDDPGLGKTLSAIGAVHKNNLYPVLVICKSALRAQWLVEFFNKTGKAAQLMSGSKDEPLEFFDVHIASYDSLPDSILLQHIEARSYAPKCVILDECQAIKNMEAKRTKAVQDIIRSLDGLKRKRDFSENLEKRWRIEMIAKDLMRYHGISDKFKLSFEILGEGKLGLTECKVEGEGLIRGRITIDKPHAEHDPEEEIIETILHEIAHALTPGAGHRPLWSECAKSIGSNGEAFAWCTGSIEPTDEFNQRVAVIALSATPIKNNAGEYFPILNILQPKRFTSFNGFVRQYVDAYSNGYGTKIGGFRRNSGFHESTSDFIFRHRREDVLKDLPPWRYSHKFIQLTGQFKSAYDKVNSDFDKFYDENEGKLGKVEVQANILAFLNRMRHVTGLAKAETAFDFIEEFLEASDRKLTIFHHHEDVGNILTAKLREAGIKFERFWANDPDRMRKTALCAQTYWPSTDPDVRVLIASTLASGEGLNLQACSDCILLERQFNPANELQAAPGRFLRIGSKADMIDVNVIIAVKTIDEWLTQLVEAKRVLVEFAIDAKIGEINDASIIRELASIIRSQNRRAWNFRDAMAPKPMPEARV